MHIKKAQEVAIQKGGKVFISNKTRVIVCAIFAVIFLALTYIVIWQWDYRISLAPLGVAMIPYMMAVSSYCAVSDTHLFVSQQMKIGAVSILKVQDKVNTVQVTFRYNGVDFGHSFSKEGYEVIKEVRAKIKELRAK